MMISDDHLTDLHAAGRLLVAPIGNTNTRSSAITPDTIDRSLADYRLAYLSRQISVVGRREVLSGNAKFGIFGDGKELAQIALARAMRPGDWRSGYYRDQTLLLALGLLSPQRIFAQLYGDTDLDADPASGGRSMVNHPASRLLDDAGHWRNQCDAPNCSADISSTAGQMPRLVGLGYASRLYRECEALHQFSQFSQNGREVAFGTIGNASCAEGLFWESINAIAVLRAPVVLSIWDDGYGISVPNEQQFPNGDLAALLAGFRRQSGSEGFDLYSVPGWEYEQLMDVYQQASEGAREQHIPAIIHVTELTQPLGHSTSGSHERYKSPERLAWEADHDSLVRLRAFLIEHGIVDELALKVQEQAIRDEVEMAREAAQQHALAPIRAEAHELAELLEATAATSQGGAALHHLADELRNALRPLRREVAAQAHTALVQTRYHPTAERTRLATWQQNYVAANRDRYGSNVHSSAATFPQTAIAPTYADDAPLVRGFEILQANFDAWLSRDPRICIFGEDVGRLGDVNQGVAGLQERYGSLRVADTGIREATIIGQGIGMALRGLRPIAEIQYLDYIYYALMTLADDLACLRWRTVGGQQAPLIIRTRGHRLEGIWHAGSPMGTLLGALRGIHLLVPRDMTRAAGCYNTLLRGSDPGLVVETLNAYRLREPLPQNFADFTVPLGTPERLRAGSDVTLATYGACCRIALAAAEVLDQVGIAVEVIDVQSLLPFDLQHTIAQSLAKTSRLVILDEDMPGGASAFILQQVLEVQRGYEHLDSPPRTITGQPHRPAHGSDGDYFSKPSAEEVVTIIYDMLHEAWPARYPPLGTT